MNDLNIKTTLPNGDEISTVRLNDYPGEIYETCVFFVQGGSTELERYDTQMHAIDGHIKYCQVDWWAKL